MMSWWQVNSMAPTPHPAICAIAWTTTHRSLQIFPLLAPQWWRKRAFKKQSMIDIISEFLHLENKDPAICAIAWTATHRLLQIFPLLAPQWWWKRAFKKPSMIDIISEFFILKTRILPFAQ
jgi:hypothetical protein